jgi:hypothetical protein
VPRTIIFYWDYSAFPLWDAETGACLDEHGSVPIDADLREDLTAWTERAPGTLHGDYDPAIVGSTAPPVNERDRLIAWRAEGEALCDRLSANLGSSFVVRYGWLGKDPPCGRGARTSLTGSPMSDR